MPQKCVCGIFLSINHAHSDGTWPTPAKPEPAPVATATTLPAPPETQPAPLDGADFVESLKGKSSDELKKLHAELLDKLDAVEAECTCALQREKEAGQAPPAASTETGPGK